MTGLPDPATVPAAAAETAAATEAGRADPDVVNVAVADAGELPPDGPDVDDSGYRGPGAGRLGRLAATTAAIEAASGGCLHYPDPDLEAAGAWLVVEPLAGRLATVARGRAAVTVELTPTTGHLDARLRACADRLGAVIEAARPRHDVYPVERDEMAAFTRGLAAFELVEVSREQGFTATFDALTTPHTGPDVLRERFRDVNGVEAVTVTVEREVERSRPDPRLRRAAEAAAAAVVGDWNYEWLPHPTAFSAIPAGDKLALGTGEPGVDRFDGGAFETGRDLLVETLSTLDGEPS